MKNRWAVTILALAVAVMLLVPAAASAAPVVIEDTAFTFSGTWHTYSDPGMSGGSNHYASYTESPGAYGEYTFTGTDVTFISTIGFNRGDVAIYVDGIYQAKVSEYNPGVVYQQRLWSKHGMGSTPHTIRIVSLGTGPGTDTLAEIDAIEIDNIPPVSTPATSPWSVALLLFAGAAVALGTRKLAVSRAD